MPTKKISLKISSTLGRVSAKITDARKPKIVLTLAHGAGAGMDHSLMVTLAKSLAELKIGTLRFNFPFMENKKRRADIPAV